MSAAARHGGNVPNVETRLEALEARRRRAFVWSSPEGMPLSIETHVKGAVGTGHVRRRCPTDVPRTECVYSPHRARRFVYARIRAYSREFTLRVGHPRRAVTTRGNKKKIPYSNGNGMESGVPSSQVAKIQRYRKLHTATQQL